MPSRYRRLFIFHACLIIIGVLAYIPLASSSERTSAPDFSLPRIGQPGNVNLTELKGRVVYLDFWATWCPPCRKSFPWMEEMHTRYKDEGLTIVAVNIDGKVELAEKFVQELNPGFIVAHDPGKKTASLYKLRAMPSSYLINRNGNIISTHLGFRTSKSISLEKEIQQALKQ